MAGKHPHDTPPPSRSARLDTLYQERLVVFEAERTALEPEPWAVRILALCRIATALSGLERTEQTVRAGRARADRDEARLEVDSAKVERLLDRAGHTQTPDEGDETDMNDRQDREGSFGNLEQVRQYIDERFGQLAERFEASGILDDVIAYCDARDPGLVVVPAEREPRAA